MEDRIKRIKFSRDRATVGIIWDRKDDLGRWGQYSIRLEEAPTPEFQKAYENVAQDVVLLAELSKDDVEQIEIRSVNFAYVGDEDVCTVVISVAKELENSPGSIAFKTPSKAFESYASSGETAKELILAEETRHRLEELIFQALAYIGGERAQMKLFDEDDKSESTADENGSVHIAESEAA